MNSAGDSIATANRARRTLASLLPEGIALGFLSLQLLITLGAPQGVASDQMFQLIAVQQHLGGVAPTINHLVTADDAELARSTAHWIDWWPPGFSLLAYFGLTLGLSFGTTARAISVLCASIGLVSWLSWARAVGAGPRALIVLAVELPWTRHVSSMMLETSGESLAFALTPLLLLLARDANRRQKLTVAVALGVLGSLTYLCKYSIGVNFVAMAGAMAVTSRGKLGARFVAPLGAICAFAIPVAAWSYFSASMSDGMGNPALDSMRAPHAIFQNLILAFSAVGLAIADVGSLVAQATDSWALRAIAGALVVSFVAGTIGAPRNDDERFAVAFAALLVLALTAIWTISSVADYSHRHAMQAGIVLTVAMVIRADVRWTAPMPAILACVLVLSAGYGAASLVAKTVRNRADAASTDGLWGQFLSASGARNVQDVARKQCDSVRQVWFVVDRTSAARIDGSKLGIGAEFWPADRLGATRSSAAAYCALAIFPTGMESDGRAEMVRLSFTQVETWRAVDVAGSVFPLWIGHASSDRPSTTRQ